MDDGELVDEVKEQAAPRSHGPFFPVFHEIMDEHGFMGGVVYGVIWRYCQMREGVCRASLKTLGATACVNEATVQRHAKQLVKGGYIEDLTPGLRGKPHTYRLTGKLKQVRSRLLEEESRKIREMGEAYFERVLQGRTERKSGAAHGNGDAPESNGGIAASKSLLAQSNRRIAQDNGADAERNGDDAQSNAEPTESRLKNLNTNTYTHPENIYISTEELRVFQEAAGFAPPKQIREDVIEAVRKVGKRLGRAARAEDLKPFLKAWAGHGWRVNNLDWLYKWAVQGEIPVREGRQSGTGLQGWGSLNLLGKGAVHTQREELSPEERERLIRFYNDPREPKEDRK